MEPVVSSVFDEMEQRKPIHYATTGQCFANFLIDRLTCFVLCMVLVFVLAIIGELAQLDLVSIFDSEDLADQLFSYLVYYFLFVSMFILSEGLFKGRTLGKLITGTRVVKEDNTPISWKDAVYRSLARIIPFEPFSAFSGDGLWHDRLSKTVVVKTRGI